MGVQTALELYRQIPERSLGLVLIAGTAENPAQAPSTAPRSATTFPIGAAVVRSFPELLTAGVG
jgi:hypothetical protein